MRPSHQQLLPQAGAGEVYCAQRCEEREGGNPKEREGCGGGGGGGNPKEREGGGGVTPKEREGVGGIPRRERGMEVHLK